MNRIIIPVIIVILVSCTLINMEYPQNSVTSAVIDSDTVCIDAYAYIDYMPYSVSEDIHINIKLVSESIVRINDEAIIYIANSDSEFFNKKAYMADTDQFHALFSCPCDTMDTLTVILEFSYSDSVYRLREDSIAVDAVF